MNPESRSHDDLELAGRLTRLEERISRLEARLDAGGVPAEAPPAETEAAVTEAAAGNAAATRPEDDFEYEVGQNWFAKVGIVALTLGAGFMLLMPFASLPAWAPPLAGLVSAGCLLALARFWHGTFELVASYLRGAGLALLYFATLRLCFFSQQPLLSADALAGKAALLAASGAILAIAYYRKSFWLVAIGLLAGYATAVAGAAPVFLWLVLLAVTGLAVVIGRRETWPSLPVVASVLGYGVYAIWMLGNPFRGHGMKFVAEPGVGPAVLMATAVLLAVGSLLRREPKDEEMVVGIGAMLNCALGYGLFAVHTAASYGGSFVWLHLAAFAVFLGLAVAFWVREQSRISTFLYAMTGYMALSLAILKAIGSPDLFVWLSLQSVVVVATAIWFKSRFIVVANFLIYAMIVLAYMVLAERESGISVGFGIVALVSARIMNWKKERLELKTEMMRNAYLLSAFLIFPYSLYHLVPAKYVGLAWVGLALFYYTMNLIVRNQKFRWMGHATLLVTSLYLVLVGTRQFEPVYRVLSFLVLGFVLLAVSVLFTRIRKGKSPPTAE